ncbi:MAG: isoleucine--tRNA ligase [Bifidobacteriaceae bacterium]|jgi:isoleucyl-tRNA synthetase|nr:isoleucine--tRNA ligase [Bifidobacteriaceae bacterium]
MAYPLNNPGEILNSSPDFPQMELKVLDYWKENNIFQKSILERDGSEEFVFYDGPPFANGLPHYGHLLTGYVKDVIPRFQTMKGKKTERRFGWDTHGLPAELEAMRELGITSKDEIEKMGIAKFNSACQKSVLKYTDEWKDYVNRQGRWVDFDNQYKTLDLTYMESVIWAFKELYKKGLAYEGFRVLPYCWQDETPLSNHELRMDDEIYQNRQDNTVTVAAKLTNSDIYILVWTTTPWTLPTNFAVAVGKDIDYVLVEAESEKFRGKKFILGKDVLPSFAKELCGKDNKSKENSSPKNKLPNFKILKNYKGKDLLGEKYYPIFDYFADPKSENYPGENAWKIVEGDFVTTTEGTGLVHLAPYGEDDMIVLNREKIIPQLSIDEKAIFTSVVSDYKGLHVFEANKQIVKDLKNAVGPHSKQNVKPILIREQSMMHSYPHCWRCRQPLIYKPVSSWFVKVTAIKDKLLKLNETINWLPENVKDGQFGKWLENARDWSISRNRYWGSPIPVWVSDNPDYPRVDVYGSLSELEKDFGVKVDNLHRPFIDSLVRPNPDDPTGNSKMKRIEDVFDCWFESGAMPFASVHYPFENVKWFENHYPADFIVEYIGQTRGWFYTMHILAGALFNCSAFKNCICHGVVLGSDGQKMSKSLRNYPDVNLVFSKNGTDAMRWFLLSSSILKGGNLSVTEQLIFDAARTVMLPFWNSYYFFVLYANASNSKKGYLAKKIDAEEYQKLNFMDKYILLKTDELILSIDKLLSDFDIASATSEIRDFFDILTNWYIRTSRDRFWNEEKEAFDTLWTVLERFARAICPLLPFESEIIWQGLTGGESVHLSKYPARLISEKQILQNQSDELTDKNLVATVDKVRSILNVGHSLRKKNNVRVRQPLKELIIVTDDMSKIKSFADLLADELNIKKLVFYALRDVSKKDFGIADKLSINARVLGPRIGQMVQAVIKSAKQGDYIFENGQISVKIDNGEIIELQEGEYSLESVIETGEKLSKKDASMLDFGGWVILNLETDDLILAEGYARDLIRDIQDTRKKQNLDVTDRIKLDLVLDKKDFQFAEFDNLLKFQNLIAKETLAEKISIIEAGQKEIKLAKI